MIDAAMDLLAADDIEFARRCQAMRDDEGRAMLGELAGQLQRLAAHIGDVAFGSGKLRFDFVLGASYAFAAGA